MLPRDSARLAAVFGYYDAEAAGRAREGGGGQAAVFWWLRPRAGVLAVRGARVGLAASA